MASIWLAKGLESMLLTSCGIDGLLCKRRDPATIYAYSASSDSEKRGQPLTTMIENLPIPRLPPVTTTVCPLRSMTKGIVGERCFLVRADEG